MFEYLELHKQEQEEKNKFLPTIQLKLKNRNISRIITAYIMEEVIKDFYEKPELFKDKDFKPKVKIVDVLDAVKDKDSLLRENNLLEERIKWLMYYCESFKKKKYIKLETSEGKIPRGKKVIDSYIVLTPLGVEEFLNLNKEDLSSQLDPFLERYLNEYTFVLEENRQYIKPDSEKIKVVLADLFKEIEPLLRDEYFGHYQKLKEKAKAFVLLKGEELDRYYKAIRATEIQYFINKVTKYDWKTKTYSMKLTDDELVEYINNICERRIKEDKREFVNKNSLKIAGAIKNRQYSIEGKINTDLESLLKINLSDGAKFEVKTQIVGVENQYGTFFYRKPTTFHNVYLANGEKLKTPSYEKVIKCL